jgi:hypothetical protein
LWSKAKGPTRKINAVRQYLRKLFVCICTESLALSLGVPKLIANNSDLVRNQLKNKITLRRRNGVTQTSAGYAIIRSYIFAIVCRNIYIEFYIKWFISVCETT